MSPIPERNDIDLQGNSEITLILQMGNQVRPDEVKQLAKGHAVMVSGAQFRTSCSVIIPQSLLVLLPLLSGPCHQETPSKKG